MSLILALLLSANLQACKQTIGLANHNAGNITVSRVHWQGACGRDEWKHVKFKTDEDGLLAIRKLLICYKRKHKINTLERLVGRWVGPSKNQAALNGYYRRLKQDLHARPSQHFDFEDIETAKKLTKSIVLAENGCFPYSDALFEKVFTQDIGE